MKFTLKAWFSQLKRYNPGFKILDLVIFAALLVLGVLLSVKSVSKKNGYVRVLANGQMYEFPLKDATYSVDGLIGVTTFTIKDGKVHITDSPCPNKTCMDQGWTSPLICLPNKVVITVEDYGELDAVSE